MGADGTKIELGDFPCLPLVSLIICRSPIGQNITEFSEHFELRHSFIIWTSDHRIHALSHDSIETQLPRSLNKISFRSV